MIKISIDSKVMKSFMSSVADQMKSKIGLNQVKKICKKQYGIATIEGVEHKDANIVVIENQVACKLDLVVRFPMSILISAKENSNSTLSENNNIQEEFADVPEELDDMLADFVGVPEELDDMPEELEIQEELDDILEEKLGDKGKVQPLFGKGTRNPKNNS